MNCTKSIKLWNTHRKYIPESTRKQTIATMAEVQLIENDRCCRKGTHFFSIASHCSQRKPGRQSNGKKKKRVRWWCVLVTVTVTVYAWTLTLDIAFLKERNYFGLNSIQCNTYNYYFAFVGVSCAIPAVNSMGWSMTVHNNGIFMQIHSIVEVICYVMLYSNNVM